MSEELNTNPPPVVKIGKYEYWDIGASTLDQLKSAKVVPDKDYGDYGKRKPDGLIIERHKKKIKVNVVIERKIPAEFKSSTQKKKTLEQCNDLCQELNANCGIATDNSSFIWFNPNQDDPKNNYTDKKKKKRSYTLVKDENGKKFLKALDIDQRTTQKNIDNCTPNTKSAIQNMEKVIESISKSNSKLIKPATRDPTDLARKIWQDLYSISSETPEKCLSTFVELLIFRYLSDLGILDVDSSGNKVNFDHILTLDPSLALKYYHKNIRTYLKELFPPSISDGTTIINGFILSSAVIEHAQSFYKILKLFEKFGEIKEISPSFKSKIFEEFMKKSGTQKNSGKHFTPRNVIDAMIKISDIDKLGSNSEICDPACGVGGFILEPMKLRSDGVDFYYKIKGKKIKPRFKFLGFERGLPHSEDSKLIITIAKANMLIFLSELLKKNVMMSQEFAKLFHSTFQLITTTILGTLSKAEYNKYDLILTNPPYIVSGSSNIKSAINVDAKLKKYYKTSGLGVESLFLEWIINSLKPGKKAFVVIPHGLFYRNNNDVRSFIKKECYIDGIISLPVNTFYNTPTKTFIIAITKKPWDDSDERESQEQQDPVFTYLASEIGETLDKNRFSQPEKNDLVEMVSLFNQFKGDKNNFQTTSARCKIQPFSKFSSDPFGKWTVDRWWSTEERVALGVEEEEVVMDLSEFKKKIKDSVDALQKYKKELSKFK